MRLAAIVLPTLLSLCISAHAHSSVSFFTGSFDELRKQAFEQSRPYLLYFSFAENKTCQVLEEYTFQEASVASLISENFLIYEIDENWKYNSTNYDEVVFDINTPTLVVFDAYSNELNRIEEFVDPKFLLTSLQSFLPERGADGYGQESTFTHNQEDQMGAATSFKDLGEDFFETAPSPHSHLSNLQDRDEGNAELEIIDELAENPISQEEESIWKRQAPIALQEMQDHEVQEVYQRFEPVEKLQREDLPLISATWDELPDHVPSQQHTQLPVEQTATYASTPTYGIQTGAFEQSYFMRHQIEYLRNHFNQDVLVEKAIKNGKTIFKVQVGPFPTEEEARAFEKRYRATSGKAGFLVVME